MALVKNAVQHSMRMLRRKRIHLSAKLLCTDRATATATARSKKNCTTELSASSKEAQKPVHEDRSNINAIPGFAVQFAAEKEKDRKGLTSRSDGQIRSVCCFAVTSCQNVGGVVAETVGHTN